MTNCPVSASVVRQRAPCDRIKVRRNLGEKDIDESFESTELERTLCRSRKMEILRAYSQQPKRKRLRFRLARCYYLLQFAIAAAAHICRSDDTTGNKWRNAWAAITDQRLCFFDNEGLATPTDGGNLKCLILSEFYVGRDGRG